MRKRHIPNVDEFSASEIEKNCNLPRRSMELLKKEGLLPSPLFEGARGKVALYDFNSLCYFAAVGAILKVSPSIIYASKLAKSIIDELVQIYGRVPFGISEFESLVRQQKLIVGELLDENGNIVPLKVMTAIIDNPEIYNKGKVTEFDWKLLVLNGRYVLSSTNTKIKIMNGVKLNDEWWNPELIIQHANRNDGVSVIPIIDYIDGNPTRANLEQVNHEISLAHDNLESKTEINISLPIRNALDAIVRLREIEKSN